MLLDTTSKTVEVVLGSAVATNQLDVTFDVTETEDVVPASVCTATNNTTAITAVSSPASGKNNKIVGGRIVNRDTATARVIVRIFDGTTRWQQVDVDLAARSTLQYDGKDWRVLLADGSIKTGVAGPSGTNGIAQLNGINDQTGTSYTLGLSDAGKDVRCTNAAAVTLTVPPNSSVAFPVGSVVLFSQGGAGAVTATAGSGVTLRAPNGAITTSQYDIRGLEKTDTDTWRVV